MLLDVKIPGPISFSDVLIAATKQLFNNSGILNCLPLPFFECAKTGITVNQLQNLLTKKKIFMIAIWWYIYIPPGVAGTPALLENLFCIVVCIQARIPLIITGPPGCSKTLSFTIAVDSILHKMCCYCCICFVIVGTGHLVLLFCWCCYNVDSAVEVAVCCHHWLCHVFYLVLWIDI